MFALDQLRPGEGGTIREVTPGLASFRLMEMGLVPGTAVVLLRHAPLGDPLEIAFRGYALSIRRSDARHVMLASRVCGEPGDLPSDSK